MEFKFCFFIYDGEHPAPQLGAGGLGNRKEVSVVEEILVYIHFDLNCLLTSFCVFEYLSISPENRK